MGATRSRSTAQAGFRSEPVSTSAPSANSTTRRADARRKPDATAAMEKARPPPPVHRRTKPRARARPRMKSPLLRLGEKARRRQLLSTTREPVRPPIGRRRNRTGTSSNLLARVSGSRTHRLRRELVNGVTRSWSRHRWRHQRRHPQRRPTAALHRAPRTAATLQEGPREPARRREDTSLKRVRVKSSASPRPPSSPSSTAPPKPSTPSSQGLTLGEMQKTGRIFCSRTVKEGKPGSDN